MIYLDVVMSSESKRWLEAIKSKIYSIYTNQVWTLVDPPESVTLIGYKWIFKNKIGVDG